MIFAWMLYAFLSACCLIPNETYVDDPKDAWRMSFLQDKFGTIDVENGVYWSSGHWSYEYSYCFQLAPNSDFAQKLITTKNLKEDANFNIDHIRNDSLYKFPHWFAPKGGTYTVWTNEPLVLIIDQNKGTLYMHATQL